MYVTDGDLQKSFSFHTTVECTGHVRLIRVAWTHFVTHFVVHNVTFREAYIGARKKIKTAKVIFTDTIKK